MSNVSEVTTAISKAMNTPMMTETSLIIGDRLLGYAHRNYMAPVPFQAVAGDIARELKNLFKQHIHLCVSKPNENNYTDMSAVQHALELISTASDYRDAEVHMIADLVLASYAVIALDYEEKIPRHLTVAVNKLLRETGVIHCAGGVRVYCNRFLPQLREHLLNISYLERDRLEYMEAVAKDNESKETFRQATSALFDISTTGIYKTFYIVNSELLSKVISINTPSVVTSVNYNEKVCKVIASNLAKSIELANISGDESKAAIDDFLSKFKALSEITSSKRMKIDNLTDISCQLALTEVVALGVIASLNNLPAEDILKCEEILGQLTEASVGMSDIGHKIIGVDIDGNVAAYAAREEAKCNKEVMDNTMTDVKNVDAVATAAAKLTKDIGVVKTLIGKLRTMNSPAAVLLESINELEQSLEIFPEFDEHTLSLKEVLKDFSFNAEASKIYLYLKDIGVFLDRLKTFSPYDISNNLIDSRLVSLESRLEKFIMAANCLSGKDFVQLCGFDATRICGIVTVAMITKIALRGDPVLMDVLIRIISNDRPIEQKIRGYAAALQRYLNATPTPLTNYPAASSTSVAQQPSRDSAHIDPSRSIPVGYRYTFNSPVSNSDAKLTDTEREEIDADISELMLTAFVKFSKKNVAANMQYISAAERILKYTKKGVIPAEYIDSDPTIAKFILGLQDMSASFFDANEETIEKINSDIWKLIESYTSFTVYGYLTMLRSLK